MNFHLITVFRSSRTRIEERKIDREREKEREREREREIRLLGVGYSTGA